MEAPELNRPKQNCPACQAVNEPDAETCRVCGSPLQPLTGTPVATALEQDLGRANLLRLRGSYKEAADLCLAILRKAPNNVTAHALLGDIYYDQDDLRQAAEWYELASDLDPSAEREKQLLQRIRERMAQADQAQTLASLGVESRPPAVNRYLFGGIVVLLLVAALGYAIGNAVRANQSGDPVVSKPIIVPPTQPPSQPTETPPTTGVPSPPLTEVQPDAIALQDIRRGPNADLVIDAVELPDRSHLVVTARPRPEESLAVTALLVASDVFVHRTSTRSATIRLVENGRIVFSGEITRDQYDEAQALSGADDPDLYQIAAQAFVGAYIDDAASTNVIPRSDPDATGSSGSVPDQYSGSPPESP